MSSYNELIKELKKRGLTIDDVTEGSNYLENAAGKNSKENTSRPNPSSKKKANPFTATSLRRTVSTIGDDIGPTAEWFQKGALEDGVSFQNAWRAARGTGVDIAEDLTIGAVSVGERVWDGMAALGPLATEAMWNANGGYYNLQATNIIQQGIDQSKKELPAYIAQNLIDEKAIARKIITDPAKEKWGVDAEKDSVLGTRVDSYVQTAGDILARGALGPVGNVASFLSVVGGEAENAFKEGASYEQAVLSGMLSGTAEMGSEALFGGIKFGGKTLTDSMARKIGSTIPNKVLATLAKWGFNTAGEGAEEVISDGLSAIGQKLTYMNEAELNELFSKEDAWESFLGGMVVGGFFEGVNIGKAKLMGTDYAAELSNNEKKVVDLEYKNRLADAEKAGKLTKREKSKIYDRVLSDMERGIISTDTIEAALGGDTYKSYQETVKGEDEKRTKLETQLKELGKLPNTVENAKKYDALQNQLEDLKITSKRSDLQKQLSQEVMSRIKTEDRLMESYRERDRRSHAFEADIQQYGEKQRAVIQKAIDSGILNNTNLTHDFVDMVAKVSADKGVAFDFTNNEKLKQSGFALDGKTVNGYVSKDGIAVNIQSVKALNTVVGHEIAHVLEGTDLYQPMQEMLIAYSKAKGDYQSRVDSLTKLYEGIEGADIQKELTADLIGDYLFTDKDFIQRLSAENRSVFQKIYDEIKYLCRVATAGSKQARELEKIKKTFAEVYRLDAKNPTADGGVKYSLNTNAKTELHRALYDRSYQNEVLLRDETPSIMTSQKGVKNLPMAMNASHIRENVFTEAEAKAQGLRVDKHTHYHGLGEDFFLNVIDGLDNVKEAYRGTKNAADPSRRENYFLLVSEFTDQNGNIVNVPVYINEHGQFNRVFVDINKISTVFGRENFRDYINRQIAGKNLVRIKNRSFQPSEPSALIAKGYGEETSNNNISDKEGNVKEETTAPLSLSAEGTSNQTYGSYNVYGEDVALQNTADEDLGPVREDLKKAPADPTVIDMRLERDKAALEAAYQAKREKMEAEVADKDAYIKKKAKALYEEISVLKKGVRASDQLSYLLEEEKDWSRIKSALINIQHTPDRQVNIHSQIEEAARKMLDLDYEDRLADINDLEAELAVNMTNLDAEAAMEKAGEGGDNAEIRKSVSDKIVKQIIAAQTELDNNRRFRQQAIDYYDTQIAETQAELEGKKNQDSKVAQTLRQRIERLSRMKTDIVADYDARIEEQEARVEKLNSKEYSRAEYRRAKQEEHLDLWENLLGDTSKWKDMKIGLQYKTKTLRRILRRVVRDSEGKPDFAKADRIYDELETKYDHNEAELKRESQRLKEVFFELDLNQAEDTYAHMMGELLYNPQTKLSQETVDEYYKKHKSHIDTEKVDKAIKESRKVFDELIGRMNERLREQGLQEIPYRQGYFPHFTNPKQNVIQKLFNWRPVDTEIPTSIAGITETFKPQRSWQSFNKQRQSDTTDYSLYQGLDTYIHGALDWIYHIEDLQKRRALENYIRYIHSDEHIKQKIEEIKASDMDADEAQRQINAVLDEAKNPLGGLVRELMNRTNTLANKKSAMDRGMEDSTNRKIYSTMTNLNNRINANMVVGSISSALTNFIPMVQSWHQVSPVYTVRGLREFVRSTVEDDGTIAKSDFLTNRLVEEEKLYKNWLWDNVSDKAAFMMNVIDNITSQTVWRSKYLQNLDEGMGEAAAIKDADQFAKNLMAGRSRGNAPSIFDAKNPVIKLFTAFQLEVANQYGYMFEDVPQDTVGKYKPGRAAIRLTKGYASAWLGAYVYNALYSSLVGRDAAFDPLDILIDLLNGFFDEDEEEEPLDVMLEFGGNVLDELPYISGLTGGGRIPISSALPYSGDQTPFVSMLTDVTEGNWKSFGKEFLKPLYYLGLPVAGGQVKKTVEGLSMFADDLPIAGSYTDSGKLRFPVADTFGNRAKAALFGQYSSKNARDYFDNERTPLTQEQIEEFMSTGMKIQDYWDYREGLREHDTLAEQADYIAGLDLPISTKNILANNMTDREDPIDLTEYDEYGDFEEMDFAIKNPEQYKVAQAIGDFKKYMVYKEAMTDMKLSEKADYIAGLNLTIDQKNALINSESTREEPIDLTGYENYSSFKEFEYAKSDPDGYAVAKAVGGYEAYTTYSQALGDLHSDIDEFGKKIKDSRKEKVQAYINSLNVDYYTKLLLYKSQYTSYDDENEEIVEYLNSLRDLTFEEKIAVLRKLDFEVDAEGNVYW